MLSVINPHIGQLLVTTHASDRWEERGVQDDSLADVLKRAVPFGGQRGKSILLLDGEVVFATKEGIVKTVLTKAQAIANMQQQLGQLAHLVHDPTTKEPKPTRTDKPAYLGGLVSAADPNAPQPPVRPVAKRPMFCDKTLAKVFAIYALSEGELAGELQPATGMLRNLIHHELGRRRRKQKQFAHQERQARRIKILMESLREFCTHEQLQLVFQRTKDATA